MNTSPRTTCLHRSIFQAWRVCHFFHFFGTTFLSEVNDAVKLLSASFEQFSSDSLSMSDSRLVLALAALFGSIVAYLAATMFGLFQRQEFVADGRVCSMAAPDGFSLLTIYVLLRPLLLLEARKGWEEAWLYNWQPKEQTSL